MPENSLNSDSKSSRSVLNTKDPRARKGAIQHQGCPSAPYATAVSESCQIKSMGSTGVQDLTSKSSLGKAGFPDRGACILSFLSRLFLMFSRAPSPFPISRYYQSTLFLYSFFFLDIQHFLQMQKDQCQVESFGPLISGLVSNLPFSSLHGNSSIMSSRALPWSMIKSKGFWKTCSPMQFLYSFTFSPSMLLTLICRNHGNRIALSLALSLMAVHFESPIMLFTSYTNISSPLINSPR